MAELFNRSIRNIDIHLQNVFNEAEFSENSVMKDYFLTASDGKRYTTDSADTKGYFVDTVDTIKKSYPKIELPRNSR
jgi:hypothetical protein